MSNNTIIQVTNLSKLYKIGAIGTGTLSQDLKLWWQKKLGKTDEVLNQSMLNKETYGNYIWSLKDINFEVKTGDVFGIIGRNGAGKSTLLKLLSKITKPSAGKIHLNGRIASLLEVGTGFHPDLTGRENVFLNGAILGMKTAEIKNKFDEIVDFSGIEKFIDTPVKRYSSGMYVRLAFAVAAHLEPEILVLDEVLAVGDAAFQAKCLGKMKDVSTNQGRTILFVSHSIAAIKQLCNKAILLENGLQKVVGNINDVVAVYQEEASDSGSGIRNKVPANTPGYFTDWFLEGSSTKNKHSCYSGDTCVFSFGFKAFETFNQAEVRFSIRYGDLVILHASSLSGSGTYFSVQPGYCQFKFRINIPVRDAKFDIEAVFISLGNIVDTWKSTTPFTILDNFISKVEAGVINPDIEFYTETIAIESNTESIVNKIGA